MQFYKPTETISVGSDGSVNVRKQNDVEPLFDAMKNYTDVIGKGAKSIMGAKLFGSIDPVTAEQWRRECGAGIGTKEFAEYAVKKMNDRDFRRFKVGGV